MQKNKIEAVYRLLGCNNSDIARVMDCAPSEISRVRTGSRAYKPTSRPVIRFAEGLYLYADRNGTLHSLCKLCDTKVAGCEEVVPKLISWLFDGENAVMPDLSYIEERTRSLKRQKKLLFGEKLSRVMELTSASNMRLARSINIDVSVISRFRSGLRKPKAPVDTLLASVLYDRAENQGKLVELAELCGINDGNIDLIAFSEWLYDDSTVNFVGVDNLLDSIAHFSLQERSPLPDPLLFVTDDMINTDKTAYFGIDGLREAVMRFLYNASLGSSELYLYSDQDMEWMVNDTVYRTKWMSLMIACIKAGNKIRIIHNIDRGSSEMLEAIQSWMPLHITGMIEPYVCHLGRDNRFAKTLFIRKDSACIAASVLRGKEEIGYYEYVTNAERIRIHTEEYEALLSNSSPLLSIYFHDRTPSADNISSLKCLIPQLSLGSIPEDVLQRMLYRSELKKNECEVIIRTHREKKTYFDKMLESGNITEFICLPSDEALFSGKVSLAIPKAVCEKSLFYTPEEYGAHIAEIIKIMERYTNYSIILLPEMPFSHLQIIATEQNISVTRTGELYAAFIFSEPRLLRSFTEYFSMLEAQYRTDRTAVTKRLMRFI